ncbi:hypothetical protein RHGRI_000566 [Rhododendron griersonianum]|uniref:Uncharacterized protein n=1 Tax=Rhododendron griersonianum TaxID=479676 RepID=A0AAV6LI19_9ERIC|nr:hypothetical protein RHGRI_000566 [Rhododendron griersonianum]
MLRFLMRQHQGLSYSQLEISLLNSSINMSFPFHRCHTQKISLPVDCRKLQLWC